MKMTWKNESRKKSSKRPLSQFSNLPFEQEVSSPDVLQENHSNTTELQKNLDSDENKRLARVYEEQGNKLAEDQPSQSPIRCCPSSQRWRKREGERKEKGNQELRGSLPALHGDWDCIDEDGKYREALGKWETALTFTPDRAVLHEQKAQLLLELGETWNALKAATRATELDSKWAEAWITLGRAQLNFGEPDSAIESFDRALALKPESVEAHGDRQTAVHLTKRRKQLHSTGLSANENRFVVGDKIDKS